MKNLVVIALVLIMIFLSLLINGCTHNPIMGEIDDDPVDTTGMDTMMNDTSGMDTTVIMCSPDTVYFQQSILPLLVSNCALSGCHDAESANEGVVLNSYENIFNTGDVEPFRPDNSKIFERMTEDDPDKYMPPTGKLGEDQIELVRSWINQGALNNGCEESNDGCNTENISFSQDILTIVDLNCLGCHTSSVASGGVTLDNYDGVKLVADSGQLYGAISHDPGFSNMPQGLDKLDDCTIAKIKSWIDEGAPNN